MGSASSSPNTDQWANPLWRLSNLYYIQDEAGFKVKFYPNEAQLDLLENYWYLNVILKARQRGFTTLIDLMALDQCLFNSDFSAGIIAHNMQDAQKIFRRKIRFPYDHLPEGLRTARQLSKDTETQLVFDNRSDVGVGVSMRSGTMQFLHVSEFGKICAKYPEKAREIVTGSFNAVHAGQFIFVESTAEGRGGYFYEMCQLAQRQMLEKKTRTALDFKFHFYPWWEDERYRLDPEGVQITTAMRRYFAELKGKHGIALDAEQKAWYVKKADLMREDMKREYPSTPKESFEVAVKGAYYGDEMQRARTDGRITTVPYVRSAPVNTFWDLGLSRDSGTTAIWCHQYVAMQHRFLKCHEAHGQSLDYYVRWLLETGYAFGRHFLPHDANVRRLGKHNVKSWRQLLGELMPGHSFVIVKRVEDVAIGIQQTKARFDECCFDEVGCEEGIKALDNYQREWDEANSVYSNHPLHDWCFTGDTRVLTRYGMHQMMNLPQTGEILTPCGWKRYRNPRMTRRNVPLVEVRFAGGFTVKCTPDHTFMTASGWKSAESLTMDTLILSSLTRSRSITMAASTARGLAANTFRGAVNYCIALLGLQPLATSLKDARSIIGTLKPVITSSPTWSASPLAAIAQRHGINTRPNEKRMGTSPQPRGSALPNGTHQRKVDFGTAGTPNDQKAGLNGSGRNTRALNAAISSWRWFARAVTARSIAPKYAKALRIESVRPLPQPGDVWCMTVPDGECFSLANGAVVHNCSNYADAFRQFGQGWAPADSAPDIKTEPFVPFDKMLGY